MTLNQTNGCEEVLNSLVLLWNSDIETGQLEVIQIHIDSCGACKDEMVHEQTIRSLMQRALKRSCNEQAPVELHDAIYRQIHAQMAGSFTEVVTQFSMTEISIEIDEFGQIEHHELTIEHTEEIHFLNEVNSCNNDQCDTNDQDK